MKALISISSRLKLVSFFIIDFILDSRFYILDPRYNNLASWMFFRNYIALLDQFSALRSLYMSDNRTNISYGNGFPHMWHKRLCLACWFIIKKCIVEKKMWISHTGYFKTLSSIVIYLEATKPSFTNLFKTLRPKIKMIVALQATFSNWISCVKNVLL